MSAFDLKPIETPLTEDYLKIKTPFRMQVIGSSGTGKSSFILRLLTHRAKSILFQAPHNDFRKVIYLHGGLSPPTWEIIDKLKAICPDFEHHEGLVDFATDPARGPILLVVDDLHPEVYDSKDMLKMFMMKSRHLNVSCIITQQSPFPGGRYARDIVSNLTHSVVLRSNECTRTGRLSKKLTNRPNALKDILDYIRKEHPEEERPYVLIDSHPESSLESLAIRSLVFPRVIADQSLEIFCPIIFVPSGDKLPANN